MNTINIIGRLIQDPELRSINDDRKLAKFSIAYNERWSTGEHTSFFDVIAWGRQAETVSNFFKKGQRMGIQGRLRQERFEDKEGNKRNRVVIVLNEFTFIEPKGSDGQGSSSSAYSNQPPSAKSNDMENGDLPSFDEDGEEVPF